MISFLQSLKILPRWIILLIDFNILLVSAFLGYLLRFNFLIEEIFRPSFYSGILLFVATGIFSILITQSYAGIIRYTGLQDGIRIFYAASLGVTLALLINYLNINFAGTAIIPFSVLIISYLNSLIFLFSYRLFVKYVFAKYAKKIGKKDNALILGSGTSGSITHQIIEQDPNATIKVVAFLEENDNSKIGKEMNGLKIFDARNNITSIIKKFKISEIILSLEELSIERKNEIVDQCLNNQVKVRIIPYMEKWVKGVFKPNQIRTINIEDLLGRKSIKLNNPEVKNHLKGKRIFISGAAGSIGSEIAKQVLFYHPSQIILADNAESDLFEKCHELEQLNGNCEIREILVDIRNARRIDNIFNKFKPEVVFHAAAYKHVPLMEDNPSEAVSCNILGTKNLADLSVKHQVERFVMISTDKAVNPSGVMGASKRIAEMYVQALSNHIKKKNPNSTSFITTRFGNVLGSNGSVIPLFKKQIENGGPLTVTHPDITRYFMTIQEACELVLEAGVMGKGGEIFIFDMGRSIKIIDLARKMIQLSGYEVEKDMDIEIVGLREGEKLFQV